MTTREERRHMSRVASMGCLICGGEASLHHIREGQGMSQRASNYLVVPLCRDHHQGKISIHGSPDQFKAVYGSEYDLLAETIRRLGALITNNDDEGL